MWPRMTLSSCYEAAHYTKPPIRTICFCCCHRTLAGGPLTAVLGYFFSAIFLGRADARSRGKSGEKRGKKGEKRGKKEEKKRGSPRARPNYRSACVSRFHGSNALLLSSFYRWKTKVMAVLLSSILGRFWSLFLKNGDFCCFLSLEVIFLVLFCSFPSFFSFFSLFTLFCTSPIHFSTNAYSTCQSSMSTAWSGNLGN